MAVIKRTEMVKQRENGHLGIPKHPLPSNNIVPFQSSSEVVPFEAQFTNPVDDDNESDSSENNVESLPLIVSATVEKRRRDEPVGLTLHHIHPKRPSKSRQLADRVQSLLLEESGVDSVPTQSTLPVIVRSMSQASPFRSTNLRQGDEILTINGHRVKDPRRAAEMIRGAPAGPLTVVASQGEKIEGSTYHLVRFPITSDEQGVIDESDLGIEFKVTNNVLVRIRSIDASGFFSKAGLCVGDVILSINGDTIRTVKEASNALMCCLRNTNKHLQPSRVIALLVFSFRDIHRQVVQKELISENGINWDVAWSSDKGEKNVSLDSTAVCTDSVTLRISSATIPFRLIFDLDGTCSCSDSLAALQNISHRQNEDPSGGASSDDEGTHPRPKRPQSEVRSALDLVYRKHILTLVNSLNYRTWKYTRFLIRVLTATERGKDPEPLLLTSSDQANSQRLLLLPSSALPKPPNQSKQNEVKHRATNLLDLRERMRSTQQRRAPKGAECSPLLPQITNTPSERNSHNDGNSRNNGNLEQEDVTPSNAENNDMRRYNSKGTSTTANSSQDASSSPNSVISMSLSPHEQEDFVNTVALPNIQKRRPGTVRRRASIIPVNERRSSNGATHSSLESDSDDSSESSGSSRSSGDSYSSDSSESSSDDETSSTCYSLRDVMSKPASKPVVSTELTPYCSPPTPTRKEPAGKLATSSELVVRGQPPTISHKKHTNKLTTSTELVVRDVCHISMHRKPTSKPVTSRELVVHGNEPSAAPRSPATPTQKRRTNKPFASAQLAVRSNPSSPTYKKLVSKPVMSTEIVAHSAPSSPSHKRPINKPVTSTELVIRGALPASSRQSSDPKNQRQQRKQSTRQSRRVKIRIGSIQTMYKINPKVIGSGAFGTVRSCVHRYTKDSFAVKSILKKGNVKNAVLLKNEIALHQRVHHQNIVRVIDVVEDREYIHIVMDECKGGDLFDKVVEEEVRLGEDRVAGIVGSLLDAVAHMHELNIVHRDLKAEHMMLCSDDINSPIKLIDFGLATIHNPDAGDEPLTAFAGSPFTVAPEVIKRRYGRECDLWSVGVITYFLLTGVMPFNSKVDNDIFDKIQSGRFGYSKRAQNSISKEAKDFIAHLLRVNPKDRLTAKQALYHRWILKHHTKQSNKPVPQNEYSNNTSMRSEKAREEKLRQRTKPMAVRDPPERQFAKNCLATSA